MQLQLSRSCKPVYILGGASGGQRVITIEEEELPTVAVVATSNYKPDGETG